MKMDYLPYMNEIIAGLPERGVEIITVGKECNSDMLNVETDGRGRVEIYNVCPGIKFSFNMYAADRVSFSHSKNCNVLEVSYCRIGRIGWDMEDGISVYFGAGDMCLHTMDRCAESVMTLPTGYYDGITVSIDMDMLYNQIILSEAGVDTKNMKSRLCNQTPVVVPTCRDTDLVFSVLYDVPREQRMPYCKLKAQELLLYLSRIRPGKSTYVPQKVELIKEIRDFLVNNPGRRFTIEELSKKYLINTSTLKSVFKAVYGLPIAAYMKEYRMRFAMELLRTTDDSIAAVAEKVGYETQGKFTKAFKEMIHLLPTEYRRLYRK